MKIDSSAFRVRPGKKVKLKEWPTVVKPFCKSKKQYQEAPGRTRRGVELAATSSLRVQPLCAAADFSGDGRCRQGRRHPARHVRSQSARLPGVQFQTAERRRAGTRFSLAHDTPASRTRADRHIQSFLLRGSAGRSRAPGDSPQPGPFGRVARRKKHLEGAVSLHRGPGESPLSQRNPDRQSTSSTFRRKNSESDSSSASMSRTRTGNSASRTFTRGNTGSIT